MEKRIKYIGGAICSIAVIITAVMQRHPELHISQQGLELIGNAEGCRTQPYYCSAGVLTVGIGSTAASGEPITPHKRYTEQEIADRWVKDIAIAENCVNQYANGHRLPQGAFDALTSITFNVGCGKLKHSQLFKLAKQGDIVAMCQQFKRWIYAGGQRLPGLEKRREKETARCLQP